MTKSSKSASSVSARELLAVREDLQLDLKVDLRLDLADLEAEDAAAVEAVEAASLDDFLEDTKWANLESTDTEVRIRFSLKRSVAKTVLLQTSFKIQT